MLSCRTWCGLTLYTLIAGPSRLARVSSMAGLAHVSGVSRPAPVSGLACISGLAWLARVSSVPCAAPISCLARISRLANLSLRSGWSWDWRCRGVVAPSNKYH
jgi:hypothetical protein